MKRLILAAAMLTATSVLAQTPEVYRLSPEDAERAKALAATTPVPLFDENLPLMSRENKIHGEIGVGIGTGGPSLFGTAIVPLGDNATAILSFQRGGFGYDSLGGGYGRFGRDRFGSRYSPY